MLKETTISLLIVFLCGCSSVSYSSKHVINNSNEQQIGKTSVFHYYVNPVRPAQSAGMVQGTFKWQDGCIYLVDNKGVYSTAMFPMYPEEAVIWNERNKTLNINGRIFKMGDYISTNGQYSEYVENTPLALDYEKQGDKKCLTPILAKIGTMSIG